MTTTIEKPQHVEALEKANRVRLARAALKRQVKSGTITAAEVLLDTPTEAQNMTVGELLRAQDRWSYVRTRKFLGPLAISENRELGMFTDRQREATAEAVLRTLSLADRRRTRLALSSETERTGTKG